MKLYLFPFPTYFTVKSRLQTKYKTVKSVYIKQYKMLTLVGLCPQEMFYELSVILTDLFQNKKSIQTLQCLQSSQVFINTYSTILCCHTYFTLPSPKVISYTTHYLVQRVNARISIPFYTLR